MFVSNTLSNNVYVYQSWEKLCTMGVSSRTGVISLTYKKGDKDDIQTTDSPQNLDYKIYTTFLKNRI